jgi:hypothetical protein
MCGMPSYSRITPGLDCCEHLPPTLGDIFQKQDGLFLGGLFLVGLYYFWPHWEAYLISLVADGEGVPLCVQ